MSIVTTSWDDGDMLDARVAALLGRYNMKGTFYLAREYRTRRISDEAIREISKQHEIGAHTLTHPDLTKLSYEQKREEIVGSRKWLTNVIQKDVEMFCYPGGKYDAETIRVVQEAGYRGARTTKQPVFAEPHNPYTLGVSCTFFPKPFTHLDYLLAGYRRAFEGVAVHMPPFFSGESWQSHTQLEARVCSLFDESQKTDSPFHLYGHSWANTRYGLWPALERILAYIGGREDCEYLTNGELVERSHERIHTP